VRRFRLITVGLAAVFVVAGSAFGFAQPSGNHGSDVSAVAKPTEPPKGSDHGKAVSEVARTKDADVPEDSGDESGERKLNHGFYVSAAAHCQDVDDPATGAGPDFTAPEDCESQGNAHGEYVRSVAKSSAGKPAKAGGP
jgi:hypothetical protein